MWDYNYFKVKYYESFKISYNIIFKIKTMWDCKIKLKWKLTNEDFLNCFKLRKSKKNEYEILIIGLLTKNLILLI